VTLIVGRALLGAAGIPEEQTRMLLRIIRVLVIADITWLILGLLHLVESYARSRFNLETEDNLHARKLFTQLGILRRITGFIVIVLGLGVILTTFEEIQQLGTTLLASAGVVGIILGVAAQKTIGLVLAGLQVALTQPIRIDDVLIVEGEWGRVEEIALTYVVVKIWDERRLVLPISYFIEKPFQNWTRSSSRLLGTVFLYADYTLPVDPLREELKRILPQYTEWDRRVGVVQVTGTSEHTQEIRILVSANSSPLLFDLRCKVRESMVAFVRRDYPESLPRLRTELSGFRADETPAELES
jgi:small-conductance mechanosensitive channel